MAGFLLSPLCGVTIEDWAVGFRALDRNGNELSDAGFAPLQMPRELWRGSDAVSEIPETIVEACRPFLFMQYPLLRICRIEPRAVDLIVSAPALALLLAIEAGSGRISFCKAAQLTCAKRRSILSVLGIENTPAVLGALSVLRSPVWEEEQAEELVQIVHSSDECSKIRHIPDITVDQWESLRSAFNNRIFNLSPKLIQILCRSIQAKDTESDIVNNASNLIEDIYNMEYRAGHLSAEQLIAGLHSIRDVECQHFRTLARWQNKRQKDVYQTLISEFGTTDFPAPPLSGTETIRHIANLQKLVEEGNMMHNCVASYAESVMTGECTIYHVSEPEAATLSIDFENALPKIGQLSCEYNHSPSPVTRAAVVEWFNAALQDTVSIEIDIVK